MWDDNGGNEQRRKDLVALLNQVQFLEERPGQHVLHVDGSRLSSAGEQVPLTLARDGGYTNVREQGYRSSSATRPAHQCLGGGQYVVKSGCQCIWGPTLFQQDSLEKRILVAEHQTFICGAAMALLQCLQCLLMVLDGGLELLDVFGAPLTERSLRLPIPLLALFRRGINLWLS